MEVGAGYMRGLDGFPSLIIYNLYICTSPALVIELTGGSARSKAETGSPKSLNLGLCGLGSARSESYHYQV